MATLLHRTTVSNNIIASWLYGADVTSAKFINKVKLVQLGVSLSLLPMHAFSMVYGNILLLFLPASYPVDQDV